MKNLIVLAVATLFATNAVAAEMKWNGSAGWRYSNTSENDSLSSNSIATATTGKDASTQITRAHELRANLGVMGGWEHVEYGFGLRTNRAANNDYVLLGNNADKAIGLDQAWFRYTRDFGALDLAVTFGRQKNALAYDSQWETVYDNDVRWDGFGWNFKFGMFGLNASQYILGARSQGANTTSSYTKTDATEAGSGLVSGVSTTTNSKFYWMWAVQPYMNWKFTDDIEAMFAVSYSKFMDEGQTNGTGGAYNSSTLNGATTTTPAIANSAYKFDNKSQWDFLTTWSLPFNLNFTGEYLKANKATYDSNSIAGFAGTVANVPTVSSSAWNLGLTYGKLRKAQDFTVGYAYGSKGIGSVYDAYTNDKFQADNKGHTVILGYALADNFHLGFRWMSLKEKEGINTSGAAAVAGLPYAGVNANQMQKVSYWELTAGVAF